MELANGNVRTSGIMNYIQHLFISQNINDSSNILEVCCGRGLLIPLLVKLKFNVTYTGLDISYDNLKEAKEKALEIKPHFKVNLIEGDVTELGKYIEGEFDIIVYTSSLEHMNKEDGIKSLKGIYNVLDKDGIMYLSTPATKKQDPYKLQYKVHIYEWDNEELISNLENIGFKIKERIGLLPNMDTLVSDAEYLYGKQTSSFIKDLIKKVPKEFLEPVLASCFPDSSKEILYICTK